MNINDTSTKVILICVVILTGLLVAGAVFWGEPSSTTNRVTTIDPTRVKTETAPFVGSAAAPLTIVEWFDYQCPACKMFETGALPEIMKNYVETGKVKLVFKDMAFLGADSVTADAYNRAIWKLYPNTYFTWRTAMYNAQDAEGDQGFGDAESIDKLNATISGIDAAKVAADVKANASAYQALLAADKAEGQIIGVQSTPSFIIGTQLVLGAMPYASFQALIDPLLK